MSQPGTSGRAPQARGVARRKEILDVAAELFAGGGFNSVSLADIAATVGITQAGIFHYFPTKAALLIAVLQEREAGNERLSAAGRANGVDGLSAYFRTLELNDDNPALVQLFVILSAEALAEDHPGHDWFVQRNKSLVERMIGYVTEVVDVDRLPEGLDAETLARWIMALSHGLGAQWLIDTSAFSRHEAVSKIMILLRPYLRDDLREEGLS
ncbi:TetR/AcrR family transcriptional regulator [Microbacterium halotolerans]|uniref:TetR/AcrR family transcriptional regulator n=1 Tax=Microbacterium halotolerans TaxID=246613 RepID=UPI0013C30172|nr:TetR/AcrR family transcriptional regulator [Microbacterium halotolerans]